jgi:hypothetical protein
LMTFPTMSFAIFFPTSTRSLIGSILFPTQFLVLYDMYYIVKSLFNRSKQTSLFGS